MSPVQRLVKLKIKANSYTRFECKLEWHRRFPSILTPSYLEYIFFSLVVAWKRARKVNKRAREKFLEPKRRPLFSRLFSGYHSAIIHAVLVASAESAVPRFSEKAFCEIVLLAVFFALFQ